MPSSFLRGQDSAPNADEIKEAQSSTPVQPSPQAANLSYTDGLILGVVEGVTEYLPISSTGHLILTNRLLGLDAPTPLLDKEGNLIPGKEIDPLTDQPRPFTLEEAANAYAIIIQGGAIIAVALIYWKRLWGIVMGIFGKNKNGLLLLRNLMAGFLPAAILGLLLDDFIESVLFGVWPVVIALVAGAFLMLVVERWRKARHGPDAPDSGPDLHDLSIKQCLLVGLLQCVAMWPGTSRSMMTIVGGYVVGLSPARAAEFSFLLGLVTLSAAAGYKSLSLGPQMLAALDLGPVIFGIVVATISAALAVKWLVSYLTRHGLGLFAWYRLVLAAAVAALVLWG
ncbi:undecaprenyl-diphosphate phosphatase [Ruficoccus sp. ZRK36]|uniref:undecaprenyl-diphosphate phosphatase n=1 Tax=Ruficoccus sp. ZRK36 TaxID=2866311 RepID=UPI001C72CD98|nr:undecaprenyl-diphosphate phosphatase [Ruficoccus sp. ZRK36]QYY35941.1 undecaprenyl-diphosphate phosphatase [Ruficoccus sp. ZRK36]